MNRSRWLLWPVSFVSLSATLSAACSATPSPDDDKGGRRGQGGGSGGSTEGLGASGILSGQGGGNAPGTAPQTCAEAEAVKSYIGCEYWPTVTSNGYVYEGFAYAIAAANPTSTVATVIVERAGAKVAEAEVQPAALEIINLPWVIGLKAHGAVSSRVDGGAYKVTSSVPITLYQFNPLEYELTSKPADCPDTDFYGGCFSFSNDASLLLPKTALRNDYYVLAAPTHHMRDDNGNWRNYPGFVSVVATENDTKVRVSSNAHVLGGDGVTALEPRQEAEYTMNAGDVLQLYSASPPNVETPLPGKPCVHLDVYETTYCPTGPAYDLSGARVQSDKPVGVIAGHDCTFYPYSSGACDHLEESMFPVESLGTELVVSAPSAVDSLPTNPTNTDFTFVRVLSTASDNAVTFDPPVAAPVTLDAGEWIEIGPINQDVLIRGTDKLLVAQFMVSQGFSGNKAGGDPSLSVAIPSEQHRLAYTFLAPTTYEFNVVNVVAELGSTVLLDGVALPASEFTPVGSSAFGVARHPITGGVHTMSGDAKFGIVVYGYGDYTSYMYPGGLNLETIVVPH